MHLNLIAPTPGTPQYRVWEFLKEWRDAAEPDAVLEMEMTIGGPKPRTLKVSERDLAELLAAHERLGELLQFAITALHPDGHVREGHTFLLMPDLIKDTGNRFGPWRG